MGPAARGQPGRWLRHPLAERKQKFISYHSTVKLVKLLMSLSYTKWVHFKVSNVIVRDDFLVSGHIYMYMSCTM